MYNSKELKLTLNNKQINYITFGKGFKTLIMIQGLNTNRIKGAANSLAYMYRIFAKDYKVYLFDRRTEVYDGITVRELAADIAEAMDALGLVNADVFAVSQGGMIGQYLAIDRPDLVHRMVLAVTLSRNNEVVKEVLSNWIQMTEQENYKELVVDMAYAPGFSTAGSEGNDALDFLFGGPLSLRSHAHAKYHDQSQNQRYQFLHGVFLLVEWVFEAI